MGIFKDDNELNYNFEQISISDEQYECILTNVTNIISDNISLYKIKELNVYMFTITVYDVVDCKNFCTTHYFFDINYNPIVYCYENDYLPFKIELTYYKFNTGFINSDEIKRYLIDKNQKLVASSEKSELKPIGEDEIKIVSLGYYDNNEYITNKRLFNESPNYENSKNGKIVMLRFKKDKLNLERIYCFMRINGNMKNIPYEEVDHNHRFEVTDQNLMYLSMKY